MSASVLKSRSVDSRLLSPRADEVVRQVPLANGGLRRDHYDLLGRLRFQEQPDASWLRYSYDRHGHLSRVEHSSGERVDYEVDEQKGEWRARSERAETVIRLSEGFPVEVSQQLDGHQFSIHYQRTQSGQLAACRYPQSSDWTRIEQSEEGRATITCGDEQYWRIKTKQDERTITIDFINGTRTLEELLTGKAVQLKTIAFYDGNGSEVLNLPFHYRDQDKLDQVGPSRLAYDESGRLQSCSSVEGERAYAYDERGRLLSVRCRESYAEFHYNGGPTISGIDFSDHTRVAFTYDASGRRVSRKGPEGETRYAYNLFGQLARVELPHGPIIKYIYDGFGRLVGREEDDLISYYLVGIEGQRMVEADASGRVTESYLWHGQHCIGRVKGAMGNPLADSFHRIHGAHLGGIGDTSGRIRIVRSDDPFGADAAIEHGVAGYAGLFGDPETGLLHAGTRWYDPVTAQFLTPDSWFQEDASRRLPRALRTVLEVMPGGPQKIANEEQAYNWCSHDPVNFTDPSGHADRFVGLTIAYTFWSFVSSLLWELHLTNISYQLEVLNISFELVNQCLRCVWDTDYHAVYNVPFPPAVASWDDQNVWLALTLNGITNPQPVAWTLGNVIWIRRSDLNEVDEKAKRSLLVVNNGASYIAATQERAADMLRARNTLATASGTISGIDTSPTGGGKITGAAVTAPAAAALTDVFEAGDWIAIQLGAGPADEVRRVMNVAAADIDLDGPALPAPFAPPAAGPAPAVTLTRLDQTVIKIKKNDDVIARAITFMRGNAIHFTRQLPERFAPAPVELTEFVPSGKQLKVEIPGLFTERIVIRKKDSSANWNGYSANDFIRIQHGSNYSSTKLVRIRSNRDLIIDPQLSATTFIDLVVVKMDTTHVSLAGQNIRGAANVRVEAGNNTAVLKVLRPFDGLEIDSAGTKEKRIIKQLLLACKVDPAPAAAPPNLKVDQMSPTVTINGVMKGATGTIIEVAGGGTSRFAANKWVQIRRISDNFKTFGVLLAIDSGHNRLTLKVALPLPGFADTTAVGITLLTPTHTFDGDSVAPSPTPPGTDVLVKVTQCEALRHNDLIRIYQSGAAADAGDVREINADPIIIAELESSLPTAFVAPLTLERFTPVSATERRNATAPNVSQHLSLPASIAANPYLAGDIFYIHSGSEEVWAEFDSASATAPFSITLKEPVELEGMYPPYTVINITATGTTTNNASLDEPKVLMPRDHTVELTRRRALEEHEMRHVWQGAVYGPFLLSMPIPWLVQMGFGIFGGDNSASRASKWLRIIGIGGIDSLLSLIVWGIGSREDSTILPAKIVDAERKVVTFTGTPGASDVQKFKADSHVQVYKGVTETVNLITELNADTKTITLKAPLENPPFNTNDEIEVGVDPLEDIRRVLGFFSLNPEPLWSQHIPPGWGRVFSKLLNRDAWFPGLGLYLLQFFANGFKRDKITYEQDAAYNSGDMYTTMVKTVPEKEIFVGQFAKLFAFIFSRFGGLENERDLLGARIPGKVSATVRKDIVNLPAGVINRFKLNTLLRIEKVGDPDNAIYRRVDRTTAPGTVHLVVDLTDRFPANSDVKMSIHTSVPDGAVSTLWVELPNAKVKAKMHGTTLKQINLNSRDDFKLFFAHQRVRITMAGNPPAIGVIESVLAPIRINLAEPLPAAFVDQTNIEVFLLSDDSGVAGAYSELRSVRGTVLPVVAPATGPKEVEITSTQVAPFDADQKVKVVKVGDPLNLAIFATVASVEATSATNDKVIFKDPLPTPQFAAGTNVRIIPNRIGFRESYQVPMKDYIENTVCVLFNASQPGIYKVQALETKDVDYLDLSEIKVKPLIVTPNVDMPIFETEEITVTIQGDTTVQYKLRFPSPPTPATDGDLDATARRYTAPVLVPATPPQKLQVISIYDPGHEVFKGQGQLPGMRLTADKLTNVCQELDLKIQTLPAPAIAAVRAGSSTPFTNMPIAPRVWNIRRINPALPAGAVNPSIVIREGRPPQVLFVAPNSVAGPTSVDVEFVFGANAAHQKTIPVTIQVTA